MSAIDLNKISESSFEGMKPRRRRNAAASTSTAAAPSVNVAAGPPNRADWDLPLLAYSRQF